MNSVQVAFGDSHLSFQGYQNSCDFFFGDKAPFDTMRKGSDGGSSRVWGSVVLHEKQQHHLSLPLLAVAEQLPIYTLGVFISSPLDESVQC